MRKQIAALGLALLPVYLLAACGAGFGGEQILWTENRVKRFVSEHHTALEQAYQTEVVPAGIGYETFNIWDGEHPMMEFILFTHWGTYCGCYYSPDDVPLPFQNVEVGLTQTGETEWTWREKGDNHGTTRKIMDKWYYFEASF